MRELIATLWDKAQAAETSSDAHAYAARLIMLIDSGFLLRKADNDNPDLGAHRKTDILIKAWANRLIEAHHRELMSEPPTTEIIAISYVGDSNGS